LLEDRIVFFGCHVLLDEYLNLLLKPEFRDLNEYISLNGIKMRLIVQIGTRVIVCLSLLL
jgi:hypothetical protein